MITNIFIGYYTVKFVQLCIAIPSVILFFLVFSRLPNLQFSESSESKENSGQEKNVSFKHSVQIFCLCLIIVCDLPFILCPCNFYLNIYRCTPFAKHLVD